MKIITLDVNEKLRLQTVCFTGHRPNELGGYNLKNPVMLKLKKVLLELLEQLINEQQITRFISGGALGADFCAFWCVHILKDKYPEIENILAVPFFNQDKVWSAEQKKWYKKMKEVADSVVYVDTVDKYIGRSRMNAVPVGDYSPNKMILRNMYMVDNSKLLIAIYNGKKSGGTFRTVNYARKQRIIIYQLNPSKNFELTMLGDDEN